MPMPPSMLDLLLDFVSLLLNVDIRWQNSHILLDSSQANVSVETPYCFTFVTSVVQVLCTPPFAPHSEILVLTNPTMNKIHDMAAVRITRRGNSIFRCRRIMMTSCAISASPAEETQYGRSLEAISN
jgi:hypothetical protein